ncbi:MAG: M64 family metallopeptidase [Nanoarchaeota archaeon]
MSLNLSISQFVILVIATIAVISGVALLMNIQGMAEDTISDIPTDFLIGETNRVNRLDVIVTPQASIEGTIFTVTAETWPRKETQDLFLSIETTSISEEIILYDDGQHFDGEANDGVYGGLFDSKNKPLGEYSIQDSQQNELSNLIVHEPGCEPIFGGSSPERINFVILPAGYSDHEKFRQDALNLITEEESLSNIEPFKSHLDKLSFVLVDTLRNLECELGCHGIENAVCCNDQIVAEEASQCHYDEIIVLIDSEEDCGTASHYAKVCSGSGIGELILAHELGHSFGGLADEYVYAEYFSDYNVPESYTLKSANCDTVGCEKWKDFTKDCYEGCTSPSLYRSSPNSIMRYLSFGKFNPVSEQHIERLVLRHLTRETELISETPKKSYFTNLLYNNGSVSLAPVSLKPVRAGFQLGQPGFTATIRDKESKVLYETQVPLPLIEYPALEISDRPIINTKINIPILLPFSPEANSLEISDQGQILTTTSLAIFSPTCGDSLCDPEENHLSCAQDCNITSDNFCETSYCDPDCPSQETCLNRKEQTYIWSIILIVLALSVIGVILVKARRPSS